jgi:hypothetical protein
MAHAQSGARCAFDDRPTLGPRQRRLLTALARLARPELLHELPRVDADRARQTTGAVGRTGLDCVVLVVLEQRVV